LRNKFKPSLISVGCISNLNFYRTWLVFSKRVAGIGWLKGLT